MINVPEIGDVRDAQRILLAPAGHYSPEAIIAARMYVRNHYTEENEKLRANIESFDANSGYSSNTNIFLSHCPLRRGPSTKVHIGRGRALSALRQNPGSAWALEDGKWVRFAYSYRKWNLDTGVLEGPFIEEE